MNIHEIMIFKRNYSLEIQAYLITSKYKLYPVLKLTIPDKNKSCNVVQLKNGMKKNDLFMQRGLVIGKCFIYFFLAYKKLKRNFCVIIKEESKYNL